ncbi:M23 family metallopeptidase [Desulfuromonas sp.]|mgnify:CR=1 FL=1|uniref:M23 family metallopeptidase n=1 Tax=Desulfuromonas sp. TaxID=892 RepID=UPI0025C62D86|nr:M23 family metallopeptidase [Desulfuromonas sp.]
MKLRGILAILVAVVLVTLAIFYFQDTDAPQLSLSPKPGPISAKTAIQLTVHDAGAGLKSVEVRAVQGETTFPLASQAFAGEKTPQKLEFALDKKGLKDGPVELRVVASDGSAYHFGAGNRAEQSFTFDLDRRAPVISVVSNAHNFTQGGSGLVVYTLNEEVEKTGVTVGELFFPGHRQESGRYVSLFAFPHNMKQGEFLPKVVAVDRAGNERRAGFYYHTNRKTFRQRQINISDNFLETKTPEFEELAPDLQEPLEIFLKVNRDLRVQNRAALAGFAARTAPRPLWDGPFLRQPNAATLALFGDNRAYLHKGKKVDRQTHLGIDLASTAQAQVPAANGGNVVFADYLGIYGLCVIIDHGLGLQTLYGHLSSVEVNEGDAVTRGQTLGRTGATGMAGGDHLHYGVILAGLPVSPVEWWDGSWLNNNITGKLELAAETDAN